MSRSPTRALVIALLAGAFLLPAGAPAALAKEDGLRRRGTPEPAALQRARRRAIQRGCDFLCGRPGSVPGGNAYQGTQRTDGGFGDNRAVVALTSLAVLALMADGSTDGRGRHGKAVQRGIDFLLKLVEVPKTRYPEGYFWYPQDGTSRMHGQGFATLALATALGTSKGKRARRIRKALVKAVKCIEEAQTARAASATSPSPARTTRAASPWRSPRGCAPRAMPASW